MSSATQSFYDVPEQFSDGAWGNPMGEYPEPQVQAVPEFNSGNGELDHYANDRLRIGADAVNLLERAVKAEFSVALPADDWSLQHEQPRRQAPLTPHADIAQVVPAVEVPDIEPARPLGAIDQNTANGGNITLQDTPDPFGQQLYADALGSAAQADRAEHLGQPTHDEVRAIIDGFNPGEVTSRHQSADDVVASRRAVEIALSGGGAN
jgi:hypothetical protein